MPVRKAIGCETGGLGGELHPGGWSTVLEQHDPAVVARQNAIVLAESPCLGGKKCGKS